MRKAPVGLTIRKILKLFTAFISFGAAVLGLVALQQSGHKASSPIEFCRRIYRRFQYRKFIILELNYLPTFRSDPRGRGHGVTFLDNEKPPFTTFELLGEKGLAWHDKLMLIGALTLGWLGDFSDSIEFFQHRARISDYAGAISALFLADYCLFARSWEKEFYQDLLLHNSRRPAEQFGSWVDLLGTDLKAAEESYVNLAMKLDAPKMRGYYLKMLSALADGELAAAGVYLAKSRDLKGPSLPFTQGMIDNWAGETYGVDQLQFCKVSRKDPQSTHGTQILQPEMVCTVPFFEVKDGEVVSKSNSYRFPALYYAHLRTGVVSGQFANDVLTENLSSLKGSLLFNKPEDPRIRIFSAARAHADPQNELLALRPAKHTLSNVILLPGFSDNFFHFLFESVGSYLLLPPEVRAGRKVVLGSVMGEIKSFQRFLLEKAGVVDIETFHMSVGEFRFENAIWCSNPSWHTLPHPAVVKKFVEVMGGKFGMKECRPHRRIFFRRSGQRRLSPAIWKRLTPFCEKHNIEVFSPESMAIEDQVRLMSETQVLICETGAAASNAMYLPKGAVLIILSTQLGIKECFATLAHERDLKLIYVISGMADFFQNPMHIWTEPISDLDFVSLDRAWRLTEELTQK